LKDDSKTFFVKSDQPDPTIYFSFLPQFAEEIQKREKGIVFIGSNYVLGLLGNPALIQIGEIEKLCKDHSTKDVKSNVRD